MELLSIMGMCNHSGESYIFDELEVPEGIDVIDVVDNILLQCAELEIIYPEPGTLRKAIGVWSRANKITWNKLYYTMTVDYNPIWNVDADITENNTADRTIGRSVNLQDRESIDMTNTQTPNLVDTKSVKGFNSDTWAESERDVKTGTLTERQTGSDDITHTGTETTNDDAVGSTVIRRTGNIGVTTTQQMIEQERNVAQFNLIEFITQSFKTRFCLMLY